MTIHDNVTLTDAQRMTYLQNALTDRAKDSIIGYSYNGEFYNEAMQELKNNSGNHSMLLQLTLISWSTGPDQPLITPKVLCILQRFLDNWFKRLFFKISHPIFNLQLSLRLQKINLRPQ